MKMEGEINPDNGNNTNLNVLNLKILILIPLLFLAVLAFSTDDSAAADIYVNASGGNDANNGLSPATAKLTVKNATATVTSGSTVHIANGVYKGPGNRGITINKTMNIIGQSQTGTIIDAEKKNRIFLIISGVRVTIGNLTLTNGTTSANGGAILNNGNLTIITSTFKGNSAHNTVLADHRGGGGAISNGGYMTVTGSTFTGNSANNGHFGQDNGNGGAIRNVRVLNVYSSIFSGNSAHNVHVTGNDTNNNGGGGAIINYRGILTVFSSTFRSNIADVNGGAIVTDHGTVRVSNSTFQSNVAHDGGGAIVNGDGTVTVNRSTFTANQATGGNGNGGAIVNGFGTLRATGSTFTSNTAHTGGGAIVNGAGSVTVRTSTFRGNTAGQNGGAILNGGGVTLIGHLVTVTYSMFTSNTAKVAGGAIANYGGNFNIIRSTLNRNTAPQNGGAIISVAGVLRVNISNITRNTAHGFGGAIYNELNKRNGTLGSFTVTGSNLTYNTAKNGGAIYNRGVGTGIVHFNRIYRNSLKEIVSTQGRVDARYNWWGSNRDPASKVSGNVLVRPWLVATITARPVGSYIITVSILYDSYGNYHNPALGHVPDGIPVTFYAASGTFNPPVSYTVSGRATTHFSGRDPSIVTARVDDQLLRIRVSAAGEPTPGTVPMQDTGVPFNLLLMALISVTGGLWMSKRG